MVIRVLLILTLSVPLIALSQERARMLGIQGHYGFIIPHASAIRSLSEARPWGLQASYGRFNLSDRAWQTCNCYSRNGLTVKYFNYGNPDQLGSSLNVIHFAEAYVIPSGKWKFSVRSEMGIAYLTTVYDEVENPENEFYSARISFFLGLTPTIYYHVNQELALSASFNYNHISNSGYKLPNKGMNFPTYSVGVERYFNFRELVPKPYSLRTYDPSILLQGGFFGTFRPIDQNARSAKYPLAGALLNIMKPLSQLNGLNAGGELYHNSAFREQLERSGIDDSPWVVTVLAGHHFTFGKFYFLQQFGYYAIRPKELVKRTFYQRYTLLYKWGSAGIGASLLAHGNVANYMDVRLFYHF